MKIRAMAGLLLAACIGTASVAAAARPAVFPPKSNPYGLTYAEWVARYYQWAYSFPLDADPETDTAPGSAGQSGPVWFLPSLLDSGEVTRTLTIPAGTALFIPVLAVQYDNSTCDAPPPPPATPDELLQFAASDFKQFAREASITVDGTRPKQYVVEAGPFAYTVASENNVQQVFCVPDGATVDPAAAVGQFLILEPLPLGEHTIVIEASAGPRKEEPFFTKRITYTIHVE